MPAEFTSEVSGSYPAVEGMGAETIAGIAAGETGASGTSAAGNEQFLLQAFRTFAEAADSLERSYGKLRGDVVRLRAELEQSNAGLVCSLSENRRMREHLDQILEGLPCGVLVERSDGVISLLNPEGRRLLGLPQPPSASSSSSSLSLSSSSSSSLSPSSSLSAVPADLIDLLNRARETRDELELRLPDHRDGDGRESNNETERWLAVRHAAVPDGQSEKDPANHADSAPVSIFILRDVSDAKSLVQEREKLRREQALAEMASILAHEIRNPLGSLELFAGLLAAAALPQECHQWVEQVQAGLRTLGATVNNVLHFHSLPAPQRVPVDLGLLLDWAGGFLVPMARQARVELCLRNRLQGICFVADRHRLEQVLLNLVLNALRAMPGGGWVEISGHRTHHSSACAAVISVNDTGPGIDARQAARIFEPGFSTRPGSPGLGLAVCRKIVEQHGGSLTASNRAGSGASFALLLPLGNERQRSEAPSDEELSYGDPTEEAAG
jgi:two-component system, sensor histidine kinase FlrB